MDRVLTADEAVDIGTRLLAALGTPAAAAGEVARSLVSANLAGHDSHGLLRLPQYAQFVTDGWVDPAATPVIASRSAAAASIDGQHSWGQLAGHLAVNCAAELAGEFGIGIVTARRCNHIGRLGEYAEQLAARGLVSLLWCNSDPSVAPFGGRTRMLGTDPFAAGIPDQPPLIIDFATAAVAEGKLRIERAAGRPVPPGLILDADGRSSTDPEDFYAGGALLPFGAHKGFGLAVLVELLGGALSGNHVGFLPGYESGNGLVMIAIAPSRLVDAQAFATEIGAAAAGLRAAPPAEGVEKVLLPGDVERLTTQRRSAEGFVVPAPIWQQLTDLADRLEIALPNQDLDSSATANR